MSRTIIGTFIILVFYISSCSSQFAASPEGAIATSNNSPGSPIPEERATSLSSPTPVNSSATAEPKPSESPSVENAYPISTVPAGLIPNQFLPTPITTPFFGENRLIIYGFLFNSSLVSYSIPLESGEIVLSPINVYELVPIPQTPVNTGPGQAFSLAFSGYSDRVAYWIIGEPGRLWISNLSMTEQQIIFEDINMLYPASLGEYGAIHLQWLFSDNYLLLTVSNDPELNLLYSATEELVMPFPFQCAQLALSPKTGNPSLWCSKEGEGYSWVLEADGHWWKTEDDPELILAQESESGFFEWAWTPSGQLIFFDYTRDNDQLAIFQNGSLSYLPINSFAKFSEERSVPVFLWSSVYPTIRHSGIGSSRIIVHGTPMESGFCPSMKFKDDLYESAPCWLVVDLESGEIVWGLNHLIRDSRLEIPSDDVSVLDFRVPILNSDGRFLVISERFFNNQTYLIDITAEDILIWFPYISEVYTFVNSTE